MSKIQKTIIKFAGALLTIAAILVTPMHSVAAWGPERPTYTNESPASYATFNSITNNVAVGDERNFVRIGEAGSTDPYVNEIEVVPGKEYEVYIYYHNDAASNTNETGFGMATSTKVSSAYPTTLVPNQKGTISGVIYWSYVTPKEPNTPKTGAVWDEAFLTTKSDNVTLRYKDGTAVIHNAGAANGSVLPNSLFTKDGTLIGFNKLAGTIPGCAEYSGYITYTLVAEKTDAALDKKVSLDGTNWAESVKAKPGDTVTYQVTFKNTGTTTLTGVTFKDAHDGNVILRPGTTKVVTAANPDGAIIGDVIDNSGYNIGDVAAGATVTITYQSQVTTEQEVCGKSLKNTVTVTYNNNANKNDDAYVVVVCDGEPTPTCETNPELPECQKTCETNPEMPECQKTCETNPEMEGCEETPDEIVNTGPVEIILAIIIILGIGGSGIYFYRTKKALRTVEDKVSGKKDDKKEATKDDDKKDDTLPKS